MLFLDKAFMIVLDRQVSTDKLNILGKVIEQLASNLTFF